MTTIHRTIALLGAAVILSGAAAAASAEPAEAAAEVCPGVYVVVDLTDLGGDVVTGCAEGDPGSGREALESAGFEPVNDDSGMICTIDGQPDPCPTEFEGSYWAYWQMVDGEWVSSQVGADAADPAPGDVDGWRYNDGSVPPGLSADAVPPTAVEGDDTTSAPAENDDGGGFGPAIWTVLGVVVVALVVGLVVRRQRSTGS